VKLEPSCIVEELLLVAAASKDGFKLSLEKVTVSFKLKSPNHPNRPCQFGANRQADLFGGLNINHQLEVIWVSTALALCQA
jgi:hypothetical protein